MFRLQKIGSFISRAYILTSVRRAGSAAPESTQRMMVDQICNERHGLVLGVHIFDLDVRGDSPMLSDTAQKFDDRSDALLTNLLKLTQPPPKIGEAKVFHGFHQHFSSIAVVGLGDGCLGYNPTEQRDERKEAIRMAAAAGVRALGDVNLSKIFVESFGHAESSAEGASMALFLYQEMKDRNKRRFIPKLQLFDSCDFTGWKIGLHKASAQNLARHLQEAPGNNLTPSIFAQTSIEILSKYGINIDVRMHNWARLRNLNAFLAVGQGSCEPPVFLEILYEGCDPDICPVMLIGKGVTYNSGGLCRKKRRTLKYQRGDVSGAACVIAALRAVAALQLPINVRALVPLCTNLVGSRSFRPGDIVKSHKGKTILIERTDCEGLLMLADCLSYASEYNPKFILDVGSLSEGTYSALGTEACPCFSNNDQLYEVMRIASIHTGDRIWRLPLWDYFTEYVRKSSTSDLTNYVPLRAGGGPCRTARFLREFIPDHMDWLHMDTLSIYRTTGLYKTYLRKGMSGRPTRNLIEFLAQLSCKIDHGNKKCKKSKKRPTPRKKSHKK